MNGPSFRIDSSVGASTAFWPGIRIASMRSNDVGWSCNGNCTSILGTGPSGSTGPTGSMGSTGPTTGPTGSTTGATGATIEAAAAAIKTVTEMLWGHVLSAPAPAPTPAPAPAPASAYGYAGPAPAPAYAPASGHYPGMMITGVAYNELSGAQVGWYQGAPNVTTVAADTTGHYYLALAFGASICHTPVQLYAQGEYTMFFTYSSREQGVPTCVVVEILQADSERAAAAAAEVRVGGMYDNNSENTDRWKTLAYTFRVDATGYYIPRITGFGPSVALVDSPYILAGKPV